MRCLDALAKISVLFFSHKVSCNSFSRKSRGRENKELYIFWTRAYPPYDTIRKGEGIVFLKLGKVNQKSRYIYENRKHHTWIDKVCGWSIAATTAALDFHRWTGNVNLSYIRVCAFISADNRWSAIDSRDIDFIDISGYPFAVVPWLFPLWELLFRRGQSISSESLSRRRSPPFFHLLFFL